MTSTSLGAIHNRPPSHNFQIHRASSCTGVWHVPEPARYSLPLFYFILCFFSWVLFSGLGQRASCSHPRNFSAQPVVRCRRVPRVFSRSAFLTASARCSSNDSDNWAMRLAVRYRPRAITFLRIITQQEPIGSTFRLISANVTFHLYVLE